MREENGPDDTSNVFIQENNDTASLSTENSRLASSHRQRLDIPLFVMVSLLVLFVFGLSIFSLYAQRKNYDSAIAVTLKGEIDLNHGSILSYSRAWDFAVVKTSSLFLGFLLIFSGALYVLRTIESEFLLSVDGTKHSGMLSTTSPGLVMVTLGVILVVIVVLNKSSVEYIAPSSITPTEAGQIELGKLTSDPPENQIGGEENVVAEEKEAGQ